MAWLFLPENEQVQYLQKIALRAENPSGPQQYGVCSIFCVSNFLLPLRQHIFRQVARLLKPVPLPFSPYFYIPYLFAKWQWELRKKSWRKSEEEMKGDKERSQTWLRLKLGLTINANERNRKMGA